LKPSSINITMALITINKNASHRSKAYLKETEGEFKMVDHQLVQ